MRKIVAAALALTLVGAGGAEAKSGDGGGQGRGKGRDHFEQRGRGADDDHERPRRRDDRQWQGEQSRGWSRGERLPGAYHGQGVDYRSERLRRPPAGYRWVRVGNDYVLMATSTGLIMEVIPGY